MKSKFLNEFKQFAMRGNVIDLAVGVIIGAAFSKITSSLVGDIIMPPIGALIGGVNFTDLVITLKQASVAANGEIIPAVTINYGSFIQTIIDFFDHCLYHFSLHQTDQQTKPTKSKRDSSHPTNSTCRYSAINRNSRSPQTAKSKISHIYKQTTQECTPALFMIISLHYIGPPGGGGGGPTGGLR